MIFFLLLLSQYGLWFVIFSFYSVVSQYCCFFFLDSCEKLLEPRPSVCSGVSLTFHYQSFIFCAHVDRQPPSTGASLRNTRIEIVGWTTIANDEGSDSTAENMQYTGVYVCVCVCFVSLCTHGCCRQLSSCVFRKFSSRRHQEPDIAQRKRAIQLYTVFKRTWHSLWLWESAFF